jgi:hypothetical protein
MKEMLLNKINVQKFKILNIKEQYVFELPQLH